MVWARLHSANCDKKRFPFPKSCGAHEWRDKSDMNRGVFSAQLYVKTTERPLPAYPPIAKAARAQSTVVIEMLVSKAGDVICACSLFGHPLLRGAAVAAALKWKFEPIEASGNSAKVVGTIAIDFRLAEKDVNPIISRN